MHPLLRQERKLIALIPLIQTRTNLPAQDIIDFLTDFYEQILVQLPFENLMSECSINVMYAYYNEEDIEN